MKITSQQLGEELRNGTGDFLNHRRAVAALTIVGMASLATIALYQLGVFKRLPEPAVSVLDAKKVNGSAQAYGMLQTPDAVLGLGSYAATLGLASMGGANRTQTRPWIPMALAAKSIFDSVQSVALTRKSWVHYRAFSFYSLVTALSTLMALPLVLPEAKAGWHKLRGN